MPPDRKNGDRPSPETAHHPTSPALTDQHLQHYAGPQHFNRLTATNGERITFAELRETLGFTDGEFVSICHQPVDGSFSSSVVKANNACAQVQSLPERSCTWFSINPVEGPERHRRGRGRERDVTRWAALYLDCDIKPGAFESQERAWEFINAISDLIGTHPTAVIHSGHGLQPLWAITDAKLTDENGEFAEVPWSRAYRVTRRFDRLASKVALESFGAKLDKVADLSRVLRVPDTTNWKNARDPVGTYAVVGTGGPLADMNAIEEFLDQWSAVEVESDRPVSGEVLSPPEGWQFGKRTCPYVVTMVTAWSEESDRPEGGRHQWAMNRAVRLASAHRLGCFNEAALITSLEYLETALAYWCQRVGVPRALHPNEIGGAYRWAVAKVSTFDDQQARNELGDHKHQENEEGTDGQTTLFDGDPIPLTQSYPIPPFPVDALPDPIANMVSAIALFTQTDPAMAATCVLSVLSACTGGRARIVLRSGWEEPLNAYYATIAHSGERKSAVQQAITKPLYDAERRLDEASRDARRDAEETKKIAEQAVEKQRRKAAGAAGTSEAEQEMATALNLAAMAEAIEVPSTPRLIADDITPEALGTLLAEQGGRMAVLSAEGEILDIIAGRYNNNVPNMGIWLKGHAGDPVKVDRKGRPPEYVESPAVTLGLMIQPAVLDALAAKQEFRGRGLLARIFYAYPVSSLGSRDAEAPAPDQQVVTRYAAVVGDLAEGMAAWTDPARLPITPSAQQAVIELARGLEPTLGSEGELAHLADWGSKYVGAVCRIAGNLHLAICGPEEGVRRSVEDTTIRAAARIGEYFKACAIRAFAEMGADRITSDALYLLDRLIRLETDYVSERDLFTACNRSRFSTKEHMTPALNRLIEHGFLARQQQTERSGGGRAASPLYRVHPRAAFVAHAAESPR
jgi:hypothetical protein